MFSDCSFSGKISTRGGKKRKMRGGWKGEIWGVLPEQEGGGLRRCNYTYYRIISMREVAGKGLEMVGQKGTLLHENGKRERRSH